MKIIKKESFLPFCIAEDNEVVSVAKAACARIGLTPRFEAGGGGMDANIYNARGLTTIGVASGYSKNHTKEEQLELDSFFQSGDVIAALITAYGETCTAD